LHPAPWTCAPDGESALSFPAIPPPSAAHPLSLHDALPIYADELAEARERLTDVRRLGRDVRLRATRDGHEPRVLELGGAIDGAEDLLHLLLQVQELIARLPQRVDDQVDDPDDGVRQRELRDELQELRDLLGQLGDARG